MKNNFIETNDNLRVFASQAVTYKSLEYLFLSKPSLNHEKIHIKTRDLQDEDQKNLILKYSDVNEIKGNNVFIHPQVKYPRNSLSKEFKKVLEPSKADFCVLPQLIVPLRIYNTIHFVCKYGKRYIMYYTKEIEDSQMFEGNTVYNTELGQQIRNAGRLNPMLKEDMCELEIDYIGKGTFIVDGQSWIKDLKCNDYPTPISEFDFIQLERKDSEELTKEKYNNIEKLIKAEGDMMTMGLEVMFNMNFIKCATPFIVLTKKYPSMLDTTVKKFKYMLDTIKNAHRLDKVTCSEENFELVKDFLYEQIEKYLEKVKKDFQTIYRFTTIEIDGINIKPKTE